MSDVNTLVPADAPLFLIDALSINSRGELTGDAVQIDNGEGRGYVAIPNPGAGVLTQGVKPRHAQIILSEKMRTLLKQRLRRR